MEKLSTRSFDHNFKKDKDFSSDGRGLLYYLYGVLQGMYFEIRLSKTINSQVYAAYIFIFLYENRMICAIGPKFQLNTNLNFSELWIGNSSCNFYQNFHWFWAIHILIDDYIISLDPIISARQFEPHTYGTLHSIFQNAHFCIATWDLLNTLGTSSYFWNGSKTQHAK